MSSRATVLVRRSAAAAAAGARCPPQRLLLRCVRAASGTTNGVAWFDGHATARFHSPGWWQDLAVMTLGTASVRPPPPAPAPVCCLSGAIVDADDTPPSTRVVWHSVYSRAVVVVVGGGGGGNAQAAAGRNRGLSCTLVRSRDKLCVRARRLMGGVAVTWGRLGRYVVDAGDGAQTQIRSTLCARVPDVDGIFITHLHGDHCFGARARERACA